MSGGNGKPSIAQVIAFLLVVIPVLLFFLTIANIVWKSLPAVNQYGFSALFSTKFSNKFSGTFVEGQVGLLPALWGSILLAAIALVIALPVSLAMAVAASEFTLKGIGRSLELLLAFFSGIPPILYALLSIFILYSFVRPKLTGQGFPESDLISLMGSSTYHNGVPSVQSTLLGGILLSLLIVPFMTPLILDAIRNVPDSLKQASYGAGATRWYTLLHVTLPGALPGILSAASLGILKTIGEVIICAWTIGFGRNGMPSPWIDIFEAVPPLSSTGAGFMGGISPGAAAHTATTMDSVAFFSALMLVVLAFAILGVVSLVQHFTVRRIEQ